jgi:hypothetical protein
LPVTLFGKNQEQYDNLPAYIDPEGCVTSRWRLTWRERLSIFFTGNLWLSVLTFGDPLQPVRLDTSCPEFKLRRSGG